MEICMTYEIWKEDNRHRLMAEYLETTGDAITFDYQNWLLNQYAAESEKERNERL